MYTTRNLPNTRIDVADALRGIAVAGIILYHSVAHAKHCRSCPCTAKSILLGSEHHNNRHNQYCNKQGHCNAGKYP